MTTRLRHENIQQCELAFMLYSMKARLFHLRQFPKSPLKLLESFFFLTDFSQVGYTKKQLSKKKVVFCYI